MSINLKRPCRTPSPGASGRVGFLRRSAQLLWLGPTAAVVLGVWARPGSAEPTRPPVSLNLQGAEIRGVITALAELGGHNLVLSEGVRGTVTAKIRDLPWDQALQTILQSRGLASRMRGSVLIVAPREEFVARDQADLEALRRLADLEPVRTRAFQLNYSRAEEVARGLLGQGIASVPGAIGGSSASGGASGVASFGASGGSSGGVSTGSTGSAAGTGSARLLSPRGSVIPVMRTNQLFVTDIAARLEQVRDLIERIDRPVHQVLIEARIVQAADTFARSLGARWQSGPGQSSARPALDLPAAALGGANPAVLGLSIFGPAAARWLNLELSALEAEGRGKVVSSPRLVTSDQVEAYVKQGFRVPYRGSGSSLHGSPAVQFQEANLKLTVAPQVTPDGKVLLSVHVNKDSLGAITPDGREINTREIRTQVLVDDGGTVVIGGVYEDEQSDQASGAPWLRGLPGLGALFRSAGREARRTELLIFLTPQVLGNPPQACGAGAPGQRQGKGDHGDGGAWDIEPGGSAAAERGFGGDAGSRQVHPGSHPGPALESSISRCGS